MKIKKTFFLAALFLLSLCFTLLTNAATVTREMPEQADPNATISVTFTITNATAGEIFTIEDKIPEGFNVSDDWTVTGSNETKEEVVTRFNNSRYGWSFVPVENTVILAYNIILPETAAGTYTFDAIWFDSSGQSRDVRTITIGETLPEEPSLDEICGPEGCVCGDGKCDPMEDFIQCPADCAPPGGAKKKGKSKTPALIFVILLVLGIIGYGVYSTMKKKGKAINFGIKKGKKPGKGEKKEETEKEDFGEEEREKERLREERMRESMKEIPSFEKEPSEEEVPKFREEK